MAINAVDIMKINKYFNSHNVEDLYYSELCEAIGKKSKITDIEFLEYFTDSVIKDFKKSDKIQIKKFEKQIFMIGSFLRWINEEKTEIDESVLGKIRNIKIFYNDYVSRTKNDEDNEKIIYCLDSLLDVFEEYYDMEPCDETTYKYISEIEELNNKIEKLNIELKNANEMYENLQDSSLEKSKKINLLNAEIVSLKNKITELNQCIKSNNEQISEIMETTSELEKTRIKLNYLKEECKNLSVELEISNKKIEMIEKVKEDALVFEKRQDDLEIEIYKRLLTDQASLDEIVDCVREKGFSNDKIQTINALKSLKNKINIVTTSFSLSPKYKITSPVITKDNFFYIDIPENVNHYDILLISDFHIKTFSKEVLEGFDMINDYAVNNGINLILNLGDFYNGSGEEGFCYSNMLNNYKLIEQSIEEIPKVDGLYHAILGGNHEKVLSKYGFDPIKLLADEREDIVNLGYKHSTIYLSNNDKNFGSFDIHHPYSFDFSIDFEEEAIDFEKIGEYLCNIYTKQNSDRNKSYVDIFGHMHRNQFNFLQSYCFIPAFFDDRTKSCACHLRIYFDDAKKIKYMLFMPLTKEKKLIKNNEIVYQKILSK